MCSPFRIVLVCPERISRQMGQAGAEAASAHWGAGGLGGWWQGQRTRHISPPRCLSRTLRPGLPCVLHPVPDRGQGVCWRPGAYSPTTG